MKINHLLIELAFVVQNLNILESQKKKIEQESFKLPDGVTQQDQAKEFREKLIEKVVEEDDSVMESYLDGKEPSIDDIKNIAEELYGNILDDLINKGNTKAIERIYTITKELTEGYNISFKVIKI